MVVLDSLPDAGCLTTNSDSDSAQHAEATVTVRRRGMNWPGACSIDVATFDTLQSSSV